MKWYKVEDYPVGSDEYVLVSQYYQGSRIPYNCFVGRLREDGMWALSVDDFIKKSSIISYSREALEKIHSDIERFAEAEHLTAHANSIKVRFESERGE